MIHSGETPAVGLLLHNGRIGGRDGQAIAMAGGRIVGLGDDSAVSGLAGSLTERIDLGGRLVLPGCIDTHIHFHEWALKRQELQLEGLGSIDELLALVNRQTKRRSAGEWILGQGFNETDWSRQQIPSRGELDRVAPDHPVLLWRCDLHLAVANSAALARAAIGDETPDPPQGRIERDAQGRATGVLRELAINLVRRVVTAPDFDTIADAYGEATAALHRLGITGVHDVRLMDDNDGGRALATFSELNRNNRLGLRSWVTLPGHRLEELIDLGVRSGFGDERLRLGHVKFFADGGVGARTAWMSEPYGDAECGMPLMAMDELAEAVARADRCGLAVMVHVIGDRAISEVLTIFEQLPTRRPAKGALQPAYMHRLEHLQTIQPDDLRRLARLPLALGVTPANLLLDISLIDRVLGKRGRWAYAFRGLFDTGRPVMFSSDCPVCDPDPLLAIHAAVTRKRPDGTPPDGWYPQSKVGVGEAVRAYTSTPARVHGAVDLGAVELQKRGDLAVYSKDFISGPEDDILQAGVDLTVFDGKIVFRNF